MLYVETVKTVFDSYPLTGLVMAISIKKAVQKRDESLNYLQRMSSTAH